MSEMWKVQKPDNSVGPTGWVSVFQQRINLEGNWGELLLLGAKEADGFIDSADSNLEHSFTTLVKKIQQHQYTHDNEIMDFLTQFVSDSVRGKSDLNICTLFLYKNKIHITKCGKFLAYVLRGGRLAKLGGNNSSVVYLKGEVKNNDRYLVGSKSFFNKIPSDLNRTDFSASTLLADIKNIPYLIVDIELSVTSFVINKDGKQYLPVDHSPSTGVSLRDAQKLPNSTALKDFLTKLKGLKSLASTEDSEKVSKRRKTAAIVGIGLLIVLLASIALGIERKKNSDFKESYQQDLSIALHSIEESIDIYSLNQSRSRELFVEGRNLINKLVSDGIDDPELSKLKETVSSNQQKILGEYDAGAEDFVDLGLLTDNFSGDKIIFSNGFVNVLDKGSKKVVKLSVSTKRSEVLIGPNKVNEINDIASYGDRVFIFNSDGISEVTNVLKNVSDERVASNVLSGAFAGNLYVLDKNSSQIKRFAADGDSFGQGRNWLSTNTVVNLTSAKTMVIDGSIWVLLQDGEIVRLAQGNLVNFTLDLDFVGEISIESIFTSDETQDLYVLDRNHGKILVFGKEGEYKAQYVSELIKETVGIVVSEKDKKIILLNSNKLFSIELRHLDF